MSMHSLVASGAYPDRGSNPQPWCLGTRANHRSCPAGAASLLRVGLPPPPGLDLGAPPSALVGVAGRASARTGSAHGASWGRGPGAAPVPGTRPGFTSGCRRVSVSSSVHADRDEPTGDHGIAGPGALCSHCPRPIPAPGCTIASGPPQPDGAQAATDTPRVLIGRPVSRMRARHPPEQPPSGVIAWMTRTAGGAVLAHSAG